MSELKDIESLTSEMDADLERGYADHITTLTKENVALKRRVSELESSLSSSTRLLEERGLEVSAEQVICEIQIKKLQEKAAMRELTLEETKRLEILVKSLYLIREKGGSEIKNDFRIIPAGTTLASLTQIASVNEPVEVVEEE